MGVVDWYACLGGRKGGEGGKEGGEGGREGGEGGREGGSLKEESEEGKYKR